MREIQLQGLTNFGRYKSLLSELVRKDIKNKYRNSVLGVLWSLLDPLLYMAVMTIVFSSLFHRVQNYPVYYLSGMLIYSLFRGGSSRAMRSLVSSAGIWKSIYVPKYLYSLSAVLSDFVTYAISMLILLGVMVVTHTQFTVFLIFSSIPILITLGLTLGAGLILGTLNVFFRDVEHLYHVFTLLLMYMLPIFYPADIMPPQFRFIQTYNPLFHIIAAMRACFADGVLYDPVTLIYPAVFAIVLLILGFYMLNRYQDRFILYV